MESAEAEAHLERIQRICRCNKSPVGTELADNLLDVIEGFSQDVDLTVFILFGIRLMGISSVVVKKHLDSRDKEGYLHMVGKTAVADLLFTEENVQQ